MFSHIRPPWLILGLHSFLRGVSPPERFRWGESCSPDDACLLSSYRSSLHSAVIGHTMPDEKWDVDHKGIHLSWKAATVISTVGLGVSGVRLRSTGSQNSACAPHLANRLQSGTEV